MSKDILVRYDYRGVGGASIIELRWASAGERRGIGRGMVAVVVDVGGSEVVVVGIRLGWASGWWGCHGGRWRRRRGRGPGRRHGGGGEGMGEGDGVSMGDDLEVEARTRALTAGMGALVMVTGALAVVGC